jgi:hypothetical protein
MKRGLVMVVLAGLAVTACSELMDPARQAALVRGPGQIPVDFSAWLIQPGPPAPIPELDARGGVGSIVVDGALGTPVPCYEIHGTAERRGRDITLRVEATPLEVSCITVVATFGYRATIAALAPGTYSIRVVHSEGSRSVTVLERSVAVE